VNHPSVESLRCDHIWGNLCHTQPCRTRQERKCGGKGEGGESIHNRDRGREDGRSSGGIESPEQWKRREKKSLVLDFCLAGKEETESRSVVV
jgi:hypothetical protein